VSGRAAGPDVWNSVSERQRRVLTRAGPRRALVRLPDDGETRRLIVVRCLREEEPLMLLTKSNESEVSTALAYF
jgi:hypothetical protein